MFLAKAFRKTSNNYANSPSIQEALPINSQTKEVCDQRKRGLLHFRQYNRVSQHCSEWDRFDDKSRQILKNNLKLAVISKLMFTHM